MDPSPSIFTINEDYQFPGTIDALVAWSESHHLEMAINLLKVAFTHSSIDKPGTLDYNSLRTLGDAVLDLVVMDLLLQENPHLSKGKATVLRSSMVSNETLAQVARKLGVDPIVARAEGVALSDKTLADIFEAILSAIYFDMGYQFCRSFIASLWGLLVELSSTDNDNPKGQLQEFCQQIGLDLPEYQLVLESDEPSPDRFVFEVSVTLESEDFRAEGKGNQKKEAQANAARELLLQLRIAGFIKE